ncbi:transposase [Micromonospora sp. B11E3]|uniref:RNA-guided endonuclease InsQ/TnpB family protein n=1 Tax=Micromonospora sp. B11E3 TaxID=3153562 RepID=UPI00325CC425
MGQQRQFAWQQRKTTLGVTAQCASLTEARKELDWVADLPAQSGQQVLRQLDQAYRKWWDPQHPAGPPTRKRKSARLSVPFPGQAIAVRRVNRRRGVVSLPKIGDVKFRWSRALGGAVRNAVVSFDGVAWHVGFGVHAGVETPEAHVRPGTVVGVDRGVRSPWRCPTGGCGTAHANRLCTRHATITLERLCISAMTATAKGTIEEPGINVAAKPGLNRAILDKSWGMFEAALANRARTTGTRIVKAPAAFTSQRCSRCGNTHRNNRKSQAMFRCGSCGYQANADVNAAINVRDAAEAAPPLTGRAVRDRSHPASCRPPTQRRPRTALEAGISRP